MTKKQKPRVYLSVRVPPSLRERIEAQAQRDGRTVSATVAYALEARFPAPMKRLGLGGKRGDLLVNHPHAEMFR